MRNRLRDDGLLMVKAASKSNSSCNDDGAGHNNAHKSIPRFIIGS
jgi:hypothetical protein